MAGNLYTYNFFQKYLQKNVHKYRLYPSGKNSIARA